MAQRGRKSKYEDLIEPNIDKISAQIESGCSEQQIAKSLGVAYSTWKSYKNKFPAFSAAIKKSARARDEAVVNALYKRAVGGYVVEEKAKIINKSKSYIDENGNKILEKWQEIVKADEKRYIEPDTGACIYYLKNHMPDEYCDNPHKHEIDKEKLNLLKDKAKKEDW